MEITVIRQNDKADPAECLCTRASSIQNFIKGSLFFCPKGQQNPLPKFEIFHRS